MTEAIDSNCKLLDVFGVKVIRYLNCIADLHAIKFEVSKHTVDINVVQMNTR